jgi:glucose-1-phosphate thymidylyltransferase
MRGLILAGGTGSRLWPSTLSVNKQLLNVYDKPLIYYPLATLMAAGIREIAIIVNPSDELIFERLLGDGSQLGLSIRFITQSNPAGIAQGILLAESFIQEQNFALILGDNIFHGSGLGRQLMENSDLTGAHIFAYKVKDPENYGVVTFDDEFNVLSIVEKPKSSKSNYAVPGLYFYDSFAVGYAKRISPSARGELEITDINNLYLENNALKVSVLPRGTAWLDTGSSEGLHDASTYIRIIEERQGSKVACLEEIAWHQGWIGEDELRQISKKYVNSSYGAYLKKLLISPEERGK